MCMFSGKIDHVGATRIFVSDQGQGMHATVCRMAFRNEKPLALILPVPVLKGTNEEAITFLDLSDCRDFFDQLDRCFPQPIMFGRVGYGGSGDEFTRPRLVVHEVGDYLATYVPSIADFDRLDPGFRLSASAWETLPDYGNFGFAVFQIRPGAEIQETQPIAYRYTAQTPDELFFPTVHLNNEGEAQPRARFEHILDAQPSAQYFNIRDSDWQFSGLLPGKVMDTSGMKGIVDPDRLVARLGIEGEYPNADIVMLARGAYPRAEARVVRAPWLVGPNLNWINFLRLKKAEGTYGPRGY